MSGSVADDPFDRTRLAGERTLLAWWRTGLAAIAVGIGVGQVIPGLDPDLTRWPYISLGVGFCLYGIVLIAYGKQRGRAITEATSRREGVSPVRDATGLLAAGGVALGLATAVLTVFG